MTWENDLQEASFRGFAFDVLSVSDEISRRIVEHRFPYRDGGELEDTGRDPRPISVDAIFFGDDYLSRLITFLRLADEGATGTLTHPLLGTFEAKVIRLSVNHEASRRDSARVSVEFKEDGVDTKIALLISAQAASEALQQQVAIARDIANDLAEDAGAALPATAAALEDADSFATDVDETPGDLSNRLGQIDTNIKAALREVDALDGDQNDVSKTGLRDALRAVLLRGDDLKQRTERQRPQTRESRVRVTVPLVTLANSLYGDPARDEDLLRINKIDDPFLVAADTILKLFTE